MFREAKSRLAGAAGLVLISLTFHAGALGGWWLSDDPQVLVQAVRQSPREYFFEPKAWRYLSSSNFTPLVTLSFETDLAVAGLEPRAFYAHQLFSLTLAAILLFVYLAPYAGEIPAFLASAIFLVSPQAIVAARSLMVRHYVEGFALALIALLLWRRGRQTSPLLYSVLAAIAYLLAMLAKEVYAPIPLLMLFESAVQRERFRRFAARMAPVIAAAAGYLAWRGRMLGSVGGYQTETAFDLSANAGLLRASLGSPHPYTVWAITGALILLFLLALLRRPAVTAAFVATALVAALLPLIPVRSHLEMRHGFVVIALAAAGISLGMGAAGYRRLLPALCGAIVLVAMLLAGQQVLQRHRESSRMSVSEGKYVWSGRSDGPILLADSPGWYLAGLSELRTRQKRGSGPPFLLSDEALMIEPVDLNRLVTADGVLRTERIRMIEAERERFDPSAPLSVEFQRMANVLRWRLGPPATTEWVFLSYPRYDEYVIPPVGSRTIPEASEKQFFRIMRRLPDGRWTISPPLTLPDDGSVVRWRR